MSGMILTTSAERHLMKLETLDATFVIDTFLLLLIGVGPKIALVPFLEATSGMSEETKRRVTRKMLTTVGVRRGIRLQPVRLDCIAEDCVHVLTNAVGRID